MSNNIEVQWIATVAGALQAVDKLNQRLDKQEKALVKISETSVKGNNAAVGSYQRLEMELRKNEARLKQLAIGTAEWDKQKKKVDELRKSVAGAKAELMKTADGVGAGVMKGVAGIAKMAAGVASMKFVIDSMVSEIDHVKQLGFKSAETTRTVEQSIARMAMNLNPDQIAQAREMIVAKSPELGVSQEGLASLIASAISGGAQDLKEAMQLSQDTLKLTAGNAQDAAPIMSGMLSLAATTGERDFKAILGQLSQFQEGARGEDLAVSINNMSTALAAANTKGERVAALGGERTLEMSAVMSQILQDPTMAVTGTALRQMVQKMDSFTAVTDKKLDDGTKAKLTKAQVDAFNALGTVDERIAAMRANPVIGQQFLSGIEDNQSKVAIREIVKGTDKVRALEENAAKIITDRVGGLERFEKAAQAIEDNTVILKAETQSQANIQSSLTEGGRAGGGQATKILEDTLQNVNLTGIDFNERKAIAVEQSVREARGESPEAIALDILKRINQSSGTFLGRTGGETQTEQDRLLVERQIASLERLSAALERQEKKPTSQQSMKPREAPLPAVTTP